MPVAARKSAFERLRPARRPAPTGSTPDNRVEPFGRRCACATPRRARRVSASRLRRRSAGVAKRGSVCRSARPSASARLLQNLSVMHMMKIQPSAVGKVCTGATERCALRGWRRDDVALVQVPGRRIAELMQRDVEQAGVDVAAVAGLVRAQDAGEQAEHADRAGHEVDHRRRRRAPAGRPARRSGSSCRLPPASGSRSPASSCARCRGRRPRCAGRRSSD